MTTLERTTRDLIECPICHDILDDNAVIVVPCGYHLHEKCVMKTFEEIHTGNKELLCAYPNCKEKVANYFYDNQFSQLVDYAREIFEVLNHINMITGDIHADYSFLRKEKELKNEDSNCHNNQSISRSTSTYALTSPYFDQNIFSI